MFGTIPITDVRRSRFKRIGGNGANGARSVTRPPIRAASKLEAEETIVRWRRLSAQACATAASADPLTQLTQILPPL